MADAVAAEQGPTPRVRRWLKRLNESNNALWVLFLASFAETIVVPIPIELVLIPFMLTNRHRVWRAAFVVTAGCLIASVVGYAVGYFLFETVGRWAITTLEWEDQFDRFTEMFATYGFWAIIAIGVVPIPFQVAMLTAGAAGYPIWLFALAATIARGIRYYGLALVVRLFGDRAMYYWECHRLTAAAAATALLGALFFLTQWIGGTVA